MMAPIWAYPLLLFLGSIVGFAGTAIYQASFMVVIVYSLIYFADGVLKRKVTIDKDLIHHGFKARDMRKLLSVGTDYRASQVLPSKMILTFTGGKTLSLALNKVRVKDFQALLKLIERNYPQCQIDPVLHALLSCKKLARKVLVDDSEIFIADYASDNLIKDLITSFFRTASPWLRIGPIFCAFLSAPMWISAIRQMYFMPASSGAWNQEVTSTADAMQQLAYHVVHGLVEEGYKSGESFVHSLDNPYVSIISAILLFYLAAKVLHVLLSPNAVAVDKDGLRLMIGVFGGTITRTFIQWSDVKSVGLVKHDNGKLHIRFVTHTGAVYVDFGAVRPADRPRLTKAIERFAPDCAIETDLSEAMLPKRERSYTELWLQSLSASPERDTLKPLSVGQKLGGDRYTVVRRLGIGGQGTAYLCIDSVVNADVVLKETVIPVFADRAVKEQAMKRFEQEAAILRQFDSENIVKLEDHFFEDHRAYLVLEHIDGMNLRELVEKRGALDEERVRELSWQMCLILKYLHERSIVHRDFTPDNLILSSNGTLKLIDFNVAHNTQVGTTGTIAGKHSYLPPEQFRGRPTTQSDIYAFGATLHFLLTAQDPEPISQSSPALLNASISEQMNALVQKATTLDCKSRCRDVAELSQLLEAIETVEPALVVDGETACDAAETNDQNVIQLRNRERQTAEA